MLQSSKERQLVLLQSLQLVRAITRHARRPPKTQNYANRGRGMIGWFVSQPASLRSA